MYLHLHPTRQEALTATKTTLTRWSLDGDAPIILTRHSVSPSRLGRLMYIQDGREVWLGGIVTDAPDGNLFAIDQPLAPGQSWDAPCAIELRKCDDLSLARTIPLPHGSIDLTGLACSPDGRWIIAADDGSEWIHLIDRQTGNVSHRVYGSTHTTGLAFDPTSTLVAAILSFDGGGALSLLRLETADHYVPQPPPVDPKYGYRLPPDEVSGPAALVYAHRMLDRSDIEWPDGDLADTAGNAVFSPDGSLVVFCVMSAFCDSPYELSAYDVTSGKPLWRTYGSEECTAPPVFTPAGDSFVMAVQGGELLVYRTEDGTLLKRVASGILEPIESLAFDRDGTRLWLATEDTLTLYRPDE
jgi:WD40 repeat protein